MSGPNCTSFKIRKKKLQKNEIVSLDKIIDQKGETGLEKRKMYQNSLLKNQNGNLFHTLVFSQVF